MNIWDWVYQAIDDLDMAGHTRLAEIVTEISSLVCDGEHELAEAYAAEGVALARSIDHPWIELFIRHWLVQSRVLHRSDVKTGLEEAVRLLDFAHDERTSECPQSVCVTQDVCAAYGILDGPGYAEERLAVSQETLQRIDAGWPCFGCIITEHVSALIDAERYEEAERLCRDSLRDYQRRHGSGSPLWHLICSLADALSRQGRHEEAAKLLDRELYDADKSEELNFRLSKAREFALIGRIDEARQLLPRSDELDPSDFVSWMRAARALVDGGGMNNGPELGAVLLRFYRILRNNGALYPQAELALAAAQFAYERGDLALAAQHLADLDAVLPQLRKPERLAAAAAELRGLLE